MTIVAEMHFRHQRYLGVVVGLGLLMCPFVPSSVLGGGIVKDPNGFDGITWGASLADVPDLIEVETGEHIQSYELRHGPPKVGDVAVESLRFVTFDGQFARVTIHYRGNQTHNRMLAYLESLLGPLDRTPGSMMRGLNQQFNWRGPNTEANLTYQENVERGFVSIESRNLSPRFNDFLPE
jgi:hypothetical protein